MNKLLLTVLLLLALQSDGCGDAEAAKPTPPMPESGREAMTVDGPARTGRLEKQPGGTYLLRYPDGSASKVSANEIIPIPEGAK